MIQFQVLHYTRPEDTEQLYSDTRTLLDHFNPSNVASYMVKASDNDNAQSAMMGFVRQDLPLSGTCNDVLIIAYPAYQQPS